MPYEVTPRDIEERTVPFRSTFDLRSKPRLGEVRLRAFRRYTLRINGTTIGSGPAQNASWKDPQRYEVAAALRPGRNEIEVEVTRLTGPPALWLVLHADQATIKTDGRWQARSGEGAWSPVHLAREPVPNPVAENLPTVVEAWRDAWRIILVWLALALGATVVGLWVSRQTPAGPEIPSDDAVLGKLRRRPEWMLLGLVILLWIVLCANNLYRLPPIVGFDGYDHYHYLWFLITRHQLPLATDGWEMYQPPLYYVSTAVLVMIASAFGWEKAMTVVPQFISMAAGLAQVILVWMGARIVFPDSRRARCAALVLAAAMPMNLYIAQYPTNEMVCTALVTGALVLALRIIRDKTTSAKRYAAKEPT